MANPTIDGLISGLKTGDLINQLMQLERAPLQRIKDQQSRADLVQSAILSLQTQVTSLHTAAGNLFSRAQLGAKTVSIDTPSTSPIVLSAAANSSAANGSYQVMVNQLATATRAQSSGPLGQVIDRNSALS